LLLLKKETRHGAIRIFIRPASYEGAPRPLGPGRFLVLVISVVLAIAALTAAWIYRARQLAASDANNGARPALAHSFNAPPSQPVQSAAPPS
jgi:type VI protein secretion system component VasK